MKKEACCKERYKLSSLFFCQKAKEVLVQLNLKKNKTSIFKKIWCQLNWKLFINTYRRVVKSLNYLWSLLNCHCTIQPDILVAAEKKKNSICWWCTLWSSLIFTSKEHLHLEYQQTYRTRQTLMSSTSLEVTDTQSDIDFST